MRDKEESVMVQDLVIQLPKPVVAGKISLEEAISKRRSQRAFAPKELTVEQIGQLLWAAQGVTAEKNGHGLRSVPSGGALYPLEIYAVTKSGIFHYVSLGHQLEKKADKDYRRNLTEAALGQDSITQAPLSIVICAVYSRISKKYDQRGIRYADMEAGHAAQNIHLQAAALGLGSVPVGAFSDQRIKSVLSLPDECAPLYIIPVGFIK